MQRAEADRPSLHRVMRWAAEAILSRQRADGAILMAPVSQRENSLIPYFANLAVIGLVVAYPHTRNRAHVQAAQRWLRWYAAHQNPDGTIDDYQLRDGVLQSTGEHDSTDSYAATFLEALHRTASLSEGTQWLGKLYPAARKAADAIRLTLHRDGLTWAKPSSRVKYLMDNVEVYRGWQSAQGIAEAMGRRAEAKEFRSLAQRTLQAIDNLFYLAERGYYAWALHENGAREERLLQWYPDLMAQLMAIAWLPTAARRKALLAQLRQQFRQAWQTAIEDGDVGMLVWWGMAAVGAGDRAFAQQLILPLVEEQVRARATPNLPEYGHVLRLCAELLPLSPPREG